MWIERYVTFFCHFHKLPLSLFAYKFGEQERNPVYLKKKNKMESYKVEKY